MPLVLQNGEYRLEIDTDRFVCIEKKADTDNYDDDNAVDGVFIEWHELKSKDLGNANRLDTLVSDILAEWQPLMNAYRE